MMTYLAAFGGGLLGSAHCVGMCGGFAAIVGANRRTFGLNVIRQLTYCSGRVFTYAFLCAVGGFAGQRIAASSIPLLGAQRALSMAAGAVMLLVGVSVLAPGLTRRLIPAQFGFALVPVFRSLLSANGRWGVFLAGVANGFLPCGLVYAFVAMSVAQSDALSGLLLMAFFGAGTVPAMTLVGCGSTLVSHQLRQHIHRLAACLVIVSGVVTVERAWPRASGSCCDHPSISATATQE